MESLRSVRNGSGVGHASFAVAVDRVNLGLDQGAPLPYSRALQASSKDSVRDKIRGIVTFPNGVACYEILGYGEGIYPKSFTSLCKSGHKLADILWESVCGVLHILGLSIMGHVSLRMATRTTRKYWRIECGHEYSVELHKEW
nr:hypothetical protein Iba_chr14aCG11830 [Ipomoea batatas]